MSLSIQLVASFLSLRSSAVSVLPGLIAPVWLLEGIRVLEEPSHLLDRVQQVHALQQYWLKPFYLLQSLYKTLVRAYSLASVVPSPLRAKWQWIALL